MIERGPPWLQILRFFQEIEIMRMISFFLLDLRLSAVGTPKLRIAALEGWGMTLTQTSRMGIAPELRIVSQSAWQITLF